MKVKITVPMGTPSLNAILRGKYRNHHDYTRLREKWEHDIFAVTSHKDKASLKAKVELKQIVHVSIHVMHYKLFDRDNLVGGAKPVIDAIKRLGFIVDDSEQWIVLEVTQERNKMELTTITIESL